MGFFRFETTGKKRALSGLNSGILFGKGIKYPPRAFLDLSGGAPCAPDTVLLGVIHQFRYRKTPNNKTVMKSIVWEVALIIVGPVSIIIDWILSRAVHSAVWRLAAANSWEALAA